MDFGNSAFILFKEIDYYHQLEIEEQWGRHKDSGGRASLSENRRKRDQACFRTWNSM